MTYLWNENTYQMIKQHPDIVAWKDFATDKARLAFNDYPCVANPHLIKGSQDHIEWKQYFDTIFGCNCYFPFILRLVNSFMITGNTPQLN